MRRAIPVLATLATLTSARASRASSALEYPDNGVAQFSRGGAWLATATDPIAGYYNPAALATQATGFGIGLNLAFQSICFQRANADGSDVGPSDGFTSQGLTYTEVCNANAGHPNLIPNVAFAYRASEKLGLGLSIVPPSSFGQVEWPDRVTPPSNPGGRTEPIPSAQRYLSLYTKGTILFPTLSVGYSLTDRLHVGVGFVAGIALLEFRSMSMSNVEAGNARDNFTGDSRSAVKAKDLFVPGVVASALFEATDHLDLAAWYRYSDKVRAKGDLEVTAQYYNAAGQRNSKAEPTLSRDQKGADAAKIVLTIPMEARVGARWHMPLRPPTGLDAERFRNDRHRVRDPLRDDLYDCELDLTWANNGSADKTEIRFADGIFVANLGTVPTNADRPTGWRDSFGARLGMQYNLRRNLVGLRTGTWVETSAVKEEYLSVTSVPALRGGVAVGMVLRIQSVDLETGYQHVWNAGLDNDGNGKQRAIAATGSPDNRSYHAVNGGSVTQHANVFSLGAVTRF
ncbi:MAG: outer membrane protein transport protein [Polyangiaceae bacterium]|nr:outer membrane protein transport protein [Polyangiaceae bacterium]